MTRRLVVALLVLAGSACSAPVAGERIVTAPVPDVMPTVAHRANSRRRMSRSPRRL